MSHQTVGRIAIGLVMVASIAIFIFLFRVNLSNEAEFPGSGVFDTLTASFSEIGEPLPVQKSLVVDELFPQTIGEFSRKEVSGPDGDCGSSSAVPWAGFSASKEAFDVCMVFYETEYALAKGNESVRVGLAYLTKNKEKSVAILQQSTIIPTAFGYKGLFLNDASFSWLPKRADEPALVIIEKIRGSHDTFEFGKNDPATVVMEYFVKRYPSDKYSGEGAFEVMYDSGVENAVFPKMIESYLLQGFSGTLECEELCAYRYSAAYSKDEEKIRVSIDQVSDIPRSDAQERSWERWRQKEAAQYQGKVDQYGMIATDNNGIQIIWRPDLGAQVRLAYGEADPLPSTGMSDEERRTYYMEFQKKQSFWTPLNSNHPLVRHFIERYPSIDKHPVVSLSQSDWLLAENKHCYLTANQMVDEKTDIINTYDLYIWDNEVYLEAYGKVTTLQPDGQSMSSRKGTFVLMDGHKEYLWTHNESSAGKKTQAIGSSVVTGEIKREYKELLEGDNVFGGKFTCRPYMQKTKPFELPVGLSPDQFEGFAGKSSFRSYLKFAYSTI